MTPSLPSSNLTSIYLLMSTPLRRHFPCFLVQLYLPANLTALLYPSSTRFDEMRLQLLRLESGRKGFSPCRGRASPLSQCLRSLYQKMSLLPGPSKDPPLAGPFPPLPFPLSRAARKNPSLILALPVIPFESYAFCLFSRVPLIPPLN
jgi:hypothetical protein